MSESAGLPPMVSVDARSSSTLRRVLASNTIWIFLVLLGLIAFFSILRPNNFPTEFNIRAIATNASVLLVIAVGETFVIITGGIDLSVGYVLLFSGVCAAQVMNAWGDPTDKGWDVIGLGLIVALMAGLAWGVLNGVLVAKARVSPLIVTLGTLGMSWGLAQIISGGQDIRYIPSLMSTVLGAGRIVGVPWMVIVAASVALTGTILLDLTRFGRYTKGIGSNKEAARRAGINVDRHLIRVYALSGLLAGFGGFLSLAYFTTTTISGHANDNLNAIAAVVIGGASLMGGIGRIWGTVLGALILFTVQSGLIMVGVAPDWKKVVVAILIAAAVAAQTLQSKNGRK